MSIGAVTFKADAVCWRIVGGCPMNKGRIRTLEVWWTSDDLAHGPPVVCPNLNELRELLKQ